MNIRRIVPQGTATPEDDKHPHVEVFEVCGPKPDGVFVDGVRVDVAPDPEPVPEPAGPAGEDTED